MQLDRKLFWDVDYDKIDWEKNYQWVICRVIDRGDVNDIRLCKKYYGEEKIKKSILNSNYFSEHRMYLAAVIIDEPVENLRCYKLRQLNPTLYPY